MARSSRETGDRLPRRAAARTLRKLSFFLRSLPRRNRRVAEALRIDLGSTPSILKISALRVLATGTKVLTSADASAPGISPTRTAMSVANVTSVTIALLDPSPNNAPTASFRQLSHLVETSLSSRALATVLRSPG